MKVYHLQRTQFLPITIHEAWNFFSNPGNLAAITPSRLQFNIQYISGQTKAIYPGQIIRYRIKIFPLIWTTWVTEITHVHYPELFVDEQRFGPYAMWHHQHHFKEVPGGIEMTDVVSYAIPFWIIGQLAHWLFVSRELNSIFRFRFETLAKLFTNNELITSRST